MGYTPPFLDVRKVAGGYNVYAPSSTSGDDLIIKANTTDPQAAIELLGSGSIYLEPAAASGIRIYDGTTWGVSILYEAASNHYKIESKIDAKDLYLATTGTGVLKFGTYTAGAATDSTGYITIKDAGGTTRKLMVQA